MQDLWRAEQKSDPIRVAWGAGHEGPCDSGPLPGGQGASSRPQPPFREAGEPREAWVPPRAAVPPGLSCTEALHPRGLAGQPSPSTEDDTTQLLRPRPGETPGRWEAFRLVLGGESGQDFRNLLQEGLAEAQGSGRARPAKAGAGPGSGWGGHGRLRHCCCGSRALTEPNLFYDPLQRVQGPTPSTPGPSAAAPAGPAHPGQATSTSAQPPLPLPQTPWGSRPCLHPKSNL